MVSGGRWFIITLLGMFMFQMGLCQTVGAKLNTLFQCTVGAKLHTLFQCTCSRLKRLIQITSKMGKNSNFHYYFQTLK